MQRTKVSAGWYRLGQFEITHCPDAAVLDVEPDGCAWFLDIPPENEGRLIWGSYGRYRTLKEATAEAEALTR